MTAFEELKKEDFDIGDIVYVIDMSWQKWNGYYDFSYRKAKIVSFSVTGNVCNPNLTELLYHVDYNYFDNNKEDECCDLEWKCANELVLSCPRLGDDRNPKDELISKSLIMLENAKNNNFEKESCEGNCSSCEERKKFIDTSD